MGERVYSGGNISHKGEDESRDDKRKGREESMSGGSSASLAIAMPIRVLKLKLRLVEVIQKEIIAPEHVLKQILALNNRES
jgi:hypothetical protein